MAEMGFSVISVLSLCGMTPTIGGILRGRDSSGAWYEGIYSQLPMEIIQKCSQKGAGQKKLSTASSQRIIWVDSVQKGAAP